MAQNELTNACYELAMTVAERYGNNSDGSALINELLRAFGALGHRAREAGFSPKDGATVLWRDAYRACRDAVYWLSLCRKADLIPECEEIPLQKRLSVLERKLAEAYRHSSERDEHRRRERAEKVCFESRRLCFRGWLMTDAEALTLLGNDADYRDSGLPRYETVEEAKESIRRIGAREHTYVICHRSDRAMLGYLRFLPDGEGGARYRIELAIQPSYRRRGYAAEALEAALSFFFRTTDVDVVAAHLPCRSFFLSCLNRFGFRAEGILRRYGKNGEDVFSLSVERGDPLT